MKEKNNKSKYYVITDTHHYHDRIVTQFIFRPANFNELIIKNWQTTIKENDIVFHLGDVIWGNKEQLKSIMDQLPGTKILIRGNHDKNHSNNWFLDCGFSVVLQKAQFGNIILSHTPSILNEEEIERGIINVHGHFHSNPPERWEQHLKDRITNNHFLLSLEKVNYFPNSTELIRKRKFIQNSKELIDSIM